MTIGTLFRVLALLSAPAMAGAQLWVTDGPARPRKDLREADASFDVLRPGDLIRLAVWREPTVNGDYVLDERGRVSIPYLGDVEAAGLRHDEMRSRIRDAIAASVQDPSMQITFLRRVAVVGAVRTPGLYAADATMTVGDCLGLAGGPTLPQERWRVNLARGGRVIDREVESTRLVSSLNLRPGDQLVVPGRGWWGRNAALVIGPVTSIVVALIVYSR